MSEAHEPFDELAAGYALGALEAPDAARFERHLASGCAECARTLADYHEALARAAGDAREAPPAYVRRAVLGRVEEAPAPRRSRVALAVGWAGSMALAAGIAAALTGAYVRGRYEDRLASVASEAAALRDQLAEQIRTVGALRERLDQEERVLTLVRAENAEQARTLALLSEPATRVVTLAGLAPSPRALARVIWNPGAGGLLVATDLPPAPEGKVYELWAIAGGKPVPAGLFTVDAGGKGSVRVPALEGVPQVDVFAVTLEPAGGVPSPTGQMYLASRNA
jgi:anti-sigma-K factor RskA